jgi:hypothetical protein
METPAQFYLNFQVERRRFMPTAMRFFLLEPSLSLKATRAGQCRREAHQG